MKNLKIGQRLGGAFAAILLILAGISFLGLNGISKTFESATAMYEESVVPLSELSNVEWLGTANRILAMDMIITPEPKNVAKFTEEQLKNSDALDKSWKKYTATDLTAPEKELVKLLETSLIDYRTKGLVPIREAVNAGKVDEAMEIYKNQLSPLAPKVFETLEKLKEIQVTLAKQQFDSSLEVNKSTKIWTLGAAALAIMIGVLLAGLITISITNPMNEAVEVARSVSAGDLTRQINVHSKDETGILMQALKDMNQNLTSIVSQVRNGADNIDNAASEIALGNQDLSSRTESQAGALKETASSMEELTSTVKQNADNAHQANKLAQQAAEIAIKGGGVVSQVVDTMAAINDSSKKIVDIISVIDGIAFQTNILALNAAVEAARAGEQGRGFAVVASEVRNLAQRSAAAAKEIKVLIGDSVDKVDAGSRQVDEAGTTMNEVVSSIQRVTEIMAEITAASQEQSQGIDQINTAIVEMDNVTQQNAALVEQATAAANSMIDQSKNLLTAVDVFKINATPYSVAKKPTATKSTVTPAKPIIKSNPIPVAVKRSTPAVIKQKEKKELVEQGWEEF